MEQDAEICAQFAVEMQPFGATVVSVSSDEEAAGHVAHHKLDACFVSLDHPSVSAEALIALVRDSASNASIPTVVLVPNEKLGLLASASRVGASHFLAKPIHWIQLRQLMLSIHWRMLDERRQYRRAQVRFPVLLAFDGEHIIARSLNVSASGMLVSTEKPLTIGQQLIVAFPYSELSPAPFVISSCVARLPEWGGEVGVSFENMHSDQLERLRMWVDLFLYFQETMIQADS